MSGAEITERSLRGRLALRFATERGRTRLTGAVRTPPYHLQRLLYLDPAHPRLATVTILNSTAGLFAGDQLCLEIAVEPDAAASIGTPAMTRAFAMPAGEAIVETVIHVDRAAYLEYLPEPFLLCRDAAVAQRTDVRLASGTRIAFGEVLVFGREAHGERHAYRRLRQQLELQYGGNTVLAEALALEPGAPFNLAGLTGHFSAYGSAVLIGAQDHETALLLAIRTMLPHSAEVVGAASLLHGAPGIAVRVLAVSASMAQGLLRGLFARFRQTSCPD